MDDELRQLERAAAQDPSLEGQLLKALVRSGQLDRDRLSAAALLYHRGARDALGWPADAPIDQAQTSADGVAHLVHTVYLGPKLDRARKVGPSEQRPLCGAAADGSAPSTRLVTCGPCVRARTEEGPGLVATAAYAAELVKIPGDPQLVTRAAWLAERALLAGEGREQGWSRDLEVVAAWLVNPTPASRASVAQAVEAALAAEDDPLRCAWLAVHGGAGNERLLHDLLAGAEQALGSEGLRRALARLGAWVVGRGPEPVAP
jgi:hypothetical protein